MGFKLIAELPRSIEKEQLTGLFRLMDTRPTGSLCVAYFGYYILFRIEIELMPKKEVIEGVEFSGSLAAYHLTHDIEPQEDFLTRCKFDKSGNIECKDRSCLLEEFAPHFLAQVFDAGFAKGMKFRPT